jgi:cyclophilin family peptidyl-prolyl cis-trans isomerase
VFGKVVDGLRVVGKINAVKTTTGDRPISKVAIKKAEILVE